MTNEELLSIIEKSVIEIDFAKSFFLLCNEYCDYDNNISLKKADVSIILKELGFEMNNSAKESIFYKDYEFKDFKLRFVLPYKFGFIDCSYLFWNDDNSIRVYGGFRENLRLGNIELKNKLKYLFPIVTNNFDLKIIIAKIISLHILFIESLNLAFDLQVESHL